MATDRLEQDDKLSDADVAILAEDLSYADAVASGLAGQLLDFVLTGAQPALFANHAAFDDHLFFEALAPINYAETDEKRRRIASRMRLHDLSVFDPHVMMRFGCLVSIGRSACLSSRDLPGVETTPYWLRALFELDADFPDPAGRRLLTAGRCQEMLTLAACSIKPLVECLFVDNRPGYSWRHQHVFTLPGLAETLAGDPPAVLDAMRALDAEAQVAMTGFLAGAGLLREPAFLDAAFGWTALKKGVGKAAMNGLVHAPEAMLAERVERHLASRAPADRLIGVRVLAARLPDPQARLAAHAATETSKVVLQAIEEARALCASSTATPDDERVDGEHGYWAADGTYVEAPPFVETPPSPLLPDARDALAAVVADINAAASAEHETQRRQPWPEPTPPHTEPDGSITDFWAGIAARNEAARLERIAVLSAPYRPPLDAATVEPLLDVLTGAAPPASARRFYASLWGLVGNSTLTKARALAQKRMKAFLTRPDIDWRHLARLKLVNDGTESYAWSNFVHGIATGERTYYEVVDAELARRLLPGADMRALVALLAEHGIEEAQLMGRVIKTGAPLRCGEAPGTPTLWPVLARHLDLLDRAVTGAVIPSSDSRDRSALVLIGAFPKLPRRYLTPVLEAALGGDKSMRPLARQLARRGVPLLALLAPMIDAGEALRRLAAIRWIGDLRDRASIPVLRKALAAKRGVVDRAAIIAALAASGDDIADLFAPDRLLDEARAGLAKTKSDFSALFDVAALLILHWADGTPVAPELVRWWFNAAHKLKQPGGDALLRMALDRLAREDAARLGESVLAAFVAYDTRQLDAMEAEEAAKAELATRMRARSWDKSFTAERAMAELRVEKLGSYAHSAHEHRGLLALARHAPGPIAAAQARHMLVKHWRRTPQGKAMLDYLASNPAPAALQALIGVSRRHKTAAVQAYAAAIADRLAEERGWTRDALEDRTVPTCDLDETGGMDLVIGGLTFRAQLDEGAALSLRNPDGKPTAALPSPKNAKAEEGAAAEEAKAAKAALATLRKALKQTIEAQTRRLHEAMCGGRVWPRDDVRDILLAHPILGRLLRRVLFVGLDAEGAPKAVFRVLDDGSLTGADDDAVPWTGIAAVTLAHRARLGPIEADRWAGHLADYEVTPLFEQLTRPIRTIEDVEATEIDDRRGFMLDTFALRGAAGKLDYGRSSIEDGGGFTAYEKRFEPAGIGVVVDFTGSHVPETRRPCALGALSFVRLEGAKGAWGSPPIALGDVPPILLSEAWADYCAMAAPGTGFDPDWKAKTR